MKKTIVKTAFLTSIIILSGCTYSSKEKPIPLEQLPTEAQQVINTHFARQKVALIKLENEFADKEYDVTFTNGNKLEFDKKGNWTEVDCKNTQVPPSLIPEPIGKYLLENYPQEKVLEMSKDRRGYDLDLTNRLELKFNLDYQLVDFD